MEEFPPQSHLSDISVKVPQQWSFSQLKTNIDLHWRDDLTHSAVKCLFYIMSRTVKRGLESEVISKEQIQNQFRATRFCDAHASKSTVKRALRDLQDIGLIQVIHRYHSDGHFDVNAYKVNTHILMSRAYHSERFPTKKAPKEPKCQSLEFGNPVSNFLRQNRGRGGVTEMPKSTITFGYISNDTYRNKDSQKFSASSSKKEYIKQNSLHFSPVKQNCHFYTILEDPLIKKSFDYLSTRGLGSDEKTLLWWAKIYPYQRIVDCCEYMVHRMNQGYVVRNVGGYLRHLLEKEGSPIPDKMREIRDVAHRIQREAWPSIEVNSRCCTHPDFPGKEVIFGTDLRDFLERLDQFKKTIERAQSYAYSGQYEL